MKLIELMKLNKEELKNKIIAFPTDTVYGVGTLINDEEGIEKIYELKHREYDKPLAVLVASMEDAYTLLDSPSTKIYDLMRNYWPGALTIIGKRNSVVPQKLNPNFSTLGIRMPNNYIAIMILRKFGPMAVTSVNISGSKPLNSYEEIKNAFGNKIDFIIDEEVISSNVSSTVVDATNEELKIIREGAVKVNI